MASPVPVAARSSNGLSLYLGPPSFDSLSEFPTIENKSCRAMLFSPDGQYFAYVVGNKLNILTTNDWKPVALIEGIKTYYLSFSPKSTYLLSWEHFITSKDSPQGKPNLHIYQTGTGQLVKSFVHKKQGNWEPQWSQDEKLFLKIVNNDVVFYEDSNFDKIVTRIDSCKVNSYCLSPNCGIYFLIIHTLGMPGQPSTGRLFKYPDFESQQAIVTKSFFQADKIEVYWNSKGNNALILTSTEVDKTGGSYYGKQGLHFMSVNGFTSLITMDSEGPIYSVAWSPKNTEFCVIYGFMPSKATLFNVKCESVYEFGTGLRNFVYYNPQGNFLLLGGFGNLRGQIEVWDVIDRKRIGNCEASDSTLLEWSPDGIHFITATTAPRLRVGNGFKIWHYSGALLFEKLIQSQEELYDVCWRKFPKYYFKDPEVCVEKVSGLASTQPIPSKQAYRPPSARNRPVVNFKLDDDKNDNPQKLGGQSKTSQKNKKKREAKKAKKVDEGCAEDSINFVSNIQINLSGDPEKDKKLKNLKKKLDAIEKLKDQQAQGKTLEINQLAKIKTEDDLLQELKQLQVE